jgi:hypothetical protein
MSDPANRDNEWVHAFRYIIEPVLKTQEPPGDVTPNGMADWFLRAVVKLRTADITAEREACATIAENAPGYVDNEYEHYRPGEQIAAAIRARGHAPPKGDG